MLTIVEGEAIVRGGAPESVRGVTHGIAEVIFANLIPGNPVELHPRTIYETIVRAARAGKSAGKIASELHDAYGQGAL